MLDFVEENSAFVPVRAPRLDPASAPGASTDRETNDRDASSKETDASSRATVDREAPRGVHVGMDDPLLAVGLVVAASRHVSQTPDVLRGAHASEDDPLFTVEHRAAHAVIAPTMDRATQRGSHVSEHDPLLKIEHRAAHTTKAQSGADAPRGAHVGGDDPWACVERRAIHAMKSPAPAPLQMPMPEPAELSAADPSAAELLDALVALVGGPHAAEAGSPLTPLTPIDVCTQSDERASISEVVPHDGAAPDVAVTAEAVPVVNAAPDPAASVEVPTSPQREAPATTPPALASERQGARATARRRWRLIPIAGAAGAVAAGVGGGTAVAYIVSQGSGSSQTVTGAPVDVTIAATAGSADLLPGQPGAVSFTLHNPASSGATLEQIDPGATVVSNNTALCASDEASIAPTLPFTLPSPITVSPGGTSGTESIADFVTLAPDAPSACQGVTFAVSFTLSGRS